MNKNKHLISKITLSNGLDCILNEDNTKGYVALNIWYHVGSKNEKPGMTGFAHLFEHLMFEGSKNCNTNWFSIVEPISTGINGSTNPDRTNYWENISPEYLERVIFMEADRMGFLTEVLTDAKLEKEKKIVIQERKQNYENSPYGDSEELIQEIIFPKPHPYNWQTIGYESDIQKAKLSETIKFHKNYYVPSNASLAISGNFDSKQTIKWLEKYFGGIKTNKINDNNNKPLTSTFKKTKFHEMIGESPATLPKLITRWPTNSHIFSDNEPELDILSTILGDGIGSRLHKELIAKTQLAQSVGVSHYSSELAGEFDISITIKKEEDFDEIYKMIINEIKNIYSGKISDEEIILAKNKYKLSINRLLEKSGGFGGIADMLNYFNIYGKNPNKINNILDRYNKVTKQDVINASKYLLQNPHLHLHYKIKQ